MKFKIASCCSTSGNKGEPYGLVGEALRWACCCINWEVKDY
jgi:hypothetical protein